jgi:hypothetical protein
MAYGASQIDIDKLRSGRSYGRSLHPAGAT